MPTGFPSNPDFFVTLILAFLNRFWHNLLQTTLILGRGVHFRGQKFEFFSPTWKSGIARLKNPDFSKWRVFRICHYPDPVSGGPMEPKIVEISTCLIQLWLLWLRHGVRLTVHMRKKGGLKWNRGQITTNEVLELFAPCFQPPVLEKPGANTYNWRVGVICPQLALWSVSPFRGKRGRGK